MPEMLFTRTAEETFIFGTIWQLMHRWMYKSARAADDVGTSMLLVQQLARLSASLSSNNHCIFTTSTSFFGVLLLNFMPKQMGNHLPAGPLPF